MCVTAQMGEHAGGVIYIDTEGTFRPERLEPICARFGLDYEETLNNIKYCRVYTHDQQMEALIGCAAQMVSRVALTPPETEIVSHSRPAPRRWNRRTR